MSWKRILLLTILVNFVITQNGLDSLWESIDHYFKQNYPNEEVRNCLMGSQLVNVIPQDEEINFYYLNMDNRKTLITFSLNDDRTFRKLLASIYFEDGTVRQYLTQQETTNSQDEDLFITLQNFLKQSFGPNLSFQKLADIQSVIDENGQSYLINFNCGSELQGVNELKYQVQVLQTDDGFFIKNYRYKDIPQFDESRLRELDQEKQQNLLILADIRRVLQNKFQQLSNSFIVNIRSYGPYFEIEFQTDFRGILQKRSMTILYDIFSSQFKEIKNQILIEDIQNNPVLTQAQQILEQVQKRRNDLKDIPKTHQLINQQGIILQQTIDNGQDSGLVEKIIVNEENNKQLGSTITNKQGKILQQILLQQRNGNTVQILVEKSQNSNNQIGILIQNNQIKQIGTLEEKEIQVEKQSNQRIKSFVKQITNIVKEKDINNKQIYVQKNTILNQNQQVVHQQQVIVQLQPSQSGLILKDQTIQDNDHCLKYNQYNCVKCANRFYLNNNNKCQQVQNECKNYNHETGKCLSCYYGYYVSEGICQSIHPFCLQVNQLGQCIKCPNNYQLYKGYCYKIEQFQVQIRKDPFCARWKDENYCLQCQDGCYFNSKNECKLMDPHCYEFNFQNIICQKCLRGYVADGQTCLRSF